MQEIRAQSVVLMTLCAFATLSALSALVVRPQRASALRPRCRGSAAAIVACTIDVTARDDDELLLSEDGGVRKRVLRPGPDDSSTPVWGALVYVAYTGTLPNGTVFEEKTADAPFSFQLNTGAVVDGLERGVETMRVGERAQLTLAAEWAHGSLGVPGHIPQDSTLCYDIELLDWEEQDEVRATAHRRPRAQPHRLCARVPRRWRTTTSTYTRTRSRWRAVRRRAAAPPITGGARAARR